MPLEPKTSQEVSSSENYPNADMEIESTITDANRNDPDEMEMDDKLAQDPHFFVETEVLLTQTDTGKLNEQTNEADSTNYLFGSGFDMDLNSLGAASFDGDWDKFFMDQSVDELLELTCVINCSKDLERISKALEFNLAEEVNASAVDSCLGQIKVKKIQTIIKRIGTESNVEIRVQLLEILLKILYHFEDDFDILCSEGLKLKKTIENLLEIHLNIENKEPIIDIEFQTLMEISDWIDRAQFTINQTQPFDKIG